MIFQPIKHEFVRRLIAALLLTGATAACSNSEEAAMKKGAEAQQQLNAGQIAAARISIQEAIDERDDIPVLQLLRGRIEYASGSPTNAFNAYSVALSLDAANMEALQGVAQFGLQTGNIREAEDAAQRILGLNPTDTNGLTVHCLLYPSPSPRD